MTDEALKPCPFCGRDLEQPYLKHRGVYRHPEGVDCFAGKAIVHPETISLWNRRDHAVLATLPEVQALIAAALMEAAERIGELTSDGTAECCGAGVGGYDGKAPPECCGQPIHMIVGEEAEAAIRALITPDAMAAASPSAASPPEHRPDGRQTE